VLNYGGKRGSFSRQKFMCRALRTYTFRVVGLWVYVGRILSPKRNLVSLEQKSRDGPNTGLRGVRQPRERGAAG